MQLLREGCGTTLSQYYCTNVVAIIIVLYDSGCGIADAVRCCQGSTWGKEAEKLMSAFSESVSWQCDEREEKSSSDGRTDRELKFGMSSVRLSPAVLERWVKIGHMHEYY